MMTASDLCPPQTAIVEACPVCGATGERWKFSSRDFLHGIPGSYPYVTCLECGSVRQIVDRRLEGSHFRGPK
jgi:hypothetical protein